MIHSHNLLLSVAVISHLNAQPHLILNYFPNVSLKLWDLVYHVRHFPKATLIQRKVYFSSQSQMLPSWILSSTNSDP